MLIQKREIEYTGVKISIDNLTEYTVSLLDEVIVIRFTAYKHMILEKSYTVNDEDYFYHIGEKDIWFDTLSSSVAYDENEELDFNIFPFSHHRSFIKFITAINEDNKELLGKDSDFIIYKYHRRIPCYLGRAYDLFGNQIDRTVTINVPFPRNRRLLVAHEEGLLKEEFVKRHSNIKISKVTVGTFDRNINVGIVIPEHIYDKPTKESTTGISTDICKQYLKPFTKTLSDVCEKYDLGRITTETM